MPVKQTEGERGTYASVADVQALTPPRKFGQGTNPTNADVQLYLELVEAEINAILVEKGYAVPILESTSPMAFTFMRRVALQGAVAQIEVSAGNGPNIERTRAIYEKSLERLAEAKAVLDAPKNTDRAKPRGPGVTNLPAEEDQKANEGRAPFFRRDGSGNPGGMVF
jgi:hypothetical protein